MLYLTCRCEHLRFRIILHSGIEPEDPTQIVSFASCSEVLDMFTKFSALQELSSLHYEGVVSSIGFDCNW